MGGMVARDGESALACLVWPLPFHDPLAAFAPFAGDPVAALLDSASGDPRARYTYLAVEPYRVLTAGEDGMKIDAVPVPGDPFSVLAVLMAHRDVREASYAPVPFAGGAVGYIAYEAARHLDRFPALPPDQVRVPDMVVGFYDVVIAFDHKEQRSYLLSSGRPERSPRARAERARRRAEAVLARLGAAPARLAPPDWSVRANWRRERPREAVERSIARVVQAIRAGDIFQANLTQRCLAGCPEGLDDFTLYRRLRALSPAPFAAFLRCGPGLSIMSASPERFLRVTPQGEVETRPIKGTARRDADPATDLALAIALAQSEKDRAENLMIVDLLRNDLGRVCRLGSVEVPVLNRVETFASVHHLVSAVTGRLKPGMGALDLLRASFPGGSITGAPKIKAMEIIAELEQRRRGVSFGSLFWLGFDGAIDSNIAIRTLVHAGETLLAEAGGGIVADSDPAQEFEEAMLKMAPLLRALTGPAP